MEGWYVARIKLQKESVLTGFLSQYGVQLFFPKIISPGENGHSARNGNNGPKMQALFPTYLFCYVDPESDIWPLVRWAPGMLYFLGCDGEPASIPQMMIDYLQQRVTEWNHPTYSHQLNSGDKVMVSGGPFEGLEGIFQRYVPARQRCRILLQIVGRLTSVELPEWELKGASSTQIELVD